MDLEAFLVAMAVSNVGFAAFLVAHAHLTDRERGIWPYLTLVIGLAGVAGYFFYDRDGPL